MRAPSPVKPDEGRATTPGSRPAINCEKSAIGAFSIVDPTSIVAIVLPSLRFSVAIPAPVTTISSRVIAVWAKPMST